MGFPPYHGLLFFLLSWGASMLLTPAIIGVATHYGLYDRPGQRKIHARPLPRLGGVAIYFATLLSSGLFAWNYPDIIPVEAVEKLWALLGASTLMFFLGLYDDLRGTNAWQKLTVQLVAAIWVVGAGYRIQLLHNPLGTEFYLSSEPLVWFLSLLWIVVTTNAINLIDGLDGLAGGVCFITCLTIAFISHELGIPHLPYFTLCLAGACLGFLFFNFSPARIFLGDSGSLFLGFVLACLSMTGTVKRSTAIVMFGPPIIMALPVADTLLAIGRRLLKRAQEGPSGRARLRELLRPRELLRRFADIFRADQGHIHHGLLKVGLSHRRAVILLYLVTSLLGVTAYRMTVHDYYMSTLGVFAVLSLGLLWLLRRVKKQTLPERPLEAPLLPRPQEVD